ncbi:sensor domain-containing diguanylate cyclase [Candidatus Pantoea floridensis]|uniref:diguanylate cyclase n=1 Tax=Candidatus Pantoea floridensis TaxID=1938870 RepID=A0A286BM93_9GAMM|nr:sensor domain-containing diguanylate cyclase [Pantoea floridensis]PIF22442.1 diguanylate cyclase (GGDEF)-like protein [Enterobacteriaceae bacterium JKS000233]SOD35253.1 diguanylate cyclase (GGDEF) domain-containing protein [Pantoea floridensis]
MPLKRKMDKKVNTESGLLKSIVLSGLFLILTVVGMSLWTLREDWLATVHQTQETAMNLAVSQSRQAEDTFLQAELSLRQIQRDLQLQLATGIQGADLSHTMRELQHRLPQLHGLFYYDADGTWIATSADRVPSNINNADREYFTYQRSNRRNNLHIGPVIRSRSTGDLVIPVSLRVSDASGGFKGVLLATIKVDYFRRFYSYYELGKRDVLVLMLSDSTVLYARPMPDSYIGKDLSSSPLFQHMLAKMDRGSGQWKAALDGQARIFGFARSDRYPIIVAAGYNADDLFSIWINGRGQDIILSLILLLTILLLGTFQLRHARRVLRYQQELTSLRDELHKANLSLDKLAHIDGLTGLANRREFDRFLREALGNAAASGKPLSLIMIDIDFFKHYNDTYGHIAGDEGLKVIGELLASLSVRRSDMAARYGGEEFALILPDTAFDEGIALANRAVEAVRMMKLPHASSPLGHVTLSAGCATTSTPATVSAVKLLEHADHALYRAKRGGRNRAQGIDVPALPEQRRE